MGKAAALLGAEEDLRSRGVGTAFYVSSSVLSLPELLSL